MPDTKHSATLQGSPCVAPAPNALIVERRITRIGPQGRLEVTDCLLREESYALRVNGTEVTQLHCMPTHLEALAVGHLFTTGLLRHREEVRDVRVHEHERYINVQIQPVSQGTNISQAASTLQAGSTLQTNTCPQDSRTAHRAHTHAMDDIRISAAQVHKLQENFNQHCMLFRQTGAVHSCAVATTDGIILFLEDIARHNALDKAIGSMLLQDMSPEGKVMIFSGRLALDMLAKVVACGVRLLIAPGAPSLASVALAEAHGITLLGFVRADNINVYTCAHRVV